MNKMMKEKCDAYKIKAVLGYKRGKILCNICKGEQERISQTMVETSNSEPILQNQYQEKTEEKNQMFT